MNTQKMRYAEAAPRHLDLYDHDSDLPNYLTPYDGEWVPSTTLTSATSDPRLVRRLRRLR
ncbi:hypothetical protein KIN20_027406 [Parelaphostrongylus tenuis]|uniref:Uncharacterized protein n=1 Tax=Parelaphostrongylus tenuis TaxID=148309 RepID=A0AAD5QZI5_PARTN|nr:hypothetical protein KIN20_027401 [Parelaphostrongylus tenuis]KAJ1366672.1 hypothetical protein KIN20_027406 [Parelaphostrongylus tenuis]